MVIEDTIFVLWLMVAGPLWAAIGMVLLPLVNAGRAEVDQIPTTTLRIAGVISGFALGPIGVGLFYFEPPLIRRTTITAGIILTVFVSSQVLVRVIDPHFPSLLWLLLAGPLWAALAAIFIPRHYRDQEADDQNVLTAAALGGFAIGPLIFGLMWNTTPKIDRDWMIVLGSLGAWQIYTLFAIQKPAKPLCGGALPRNLPNAADSKRHCHRLHLFIDGGRPDADLLGARHCELRPRPTVHGWRIFFFLLPASCWQHS